MYPLDHSFDVAFANRLAQLESYNKHHYRPNSYLHKWWARRCGSTFRLVLKHLVEDPERSDYYSAGGLEGKVVLDPMLGGGTTLHEAVRLGANVIGLDIDPIPVAQAMATLRQVSSERIEVGFERLLAELHEDCGRFFTCFCPDCVAEVPVQFTLHGVLRRCTCGLAIMVDSLLIRTEPDGSGLWFCPGCHGLHRGEGCCEPRGAARLPLVAKDRQFCAECRQPYEELLEQPLFARYVPLVSAGNCPRHGDFWSPVTEDERCRMAEAEVRRQRMGEATNWAIAPCAKNDYLLTHGVGSYLDLFSGRQLCYLQAARSVLSGLEGDVRLIIALLVSTSLDFNSMLCGYKGTARRRAGAVRHTFAHHGYWLPHTALENNPLFPGGTSGTLRRLFADRVRKARRWALAPRERRLEGSGSVFQHIVGEKDQALLVNDLGQLQGGQRRCYLEQTSGARMPLEDASVDFVITDPPYYDSVQYGQLSAYFRVWLEYLLGDSPAGNGLVWRYDMDGHAEAQRYPADPAHNPLAYETVLTQVFAECRRVLRPHGRLVFTFHHWQAQAWSGLTVALRRAGFGLINAYVVHSENPKSIHIANFRSLSDDAVMVLGPSTGSGHRSWARPDDIQSTSSSDFCRACAAAVGWMLQSGLQEEAIRATWHKLLQPR
jgi:putative DNA methylase